MEREEANSTGGPTSFTLLSEECISDILSLTSPRDACRASSISWGFKSLADSDAVWERFLPSDYQHIISRAASASRILYSTKKELYFRLCNSPILLDTGRTSFSINKQNGKKCYYLLGARELSIAWKDTLVYWRWRSLPESSNFQGLDMPARTLVRLVKEREDTSDGNTNTVYLRPPKNTHAPRGQNSGYSDAEQIRRLPQKRTDGWMEVEMGEFFYDKEDEGEVDAIYGDQTPRLEGWPHCRIEIRPKEEA